MKKSHLILLQVIIASLAVACFPAKTAAQHYRGFFDLEPVVEFWKLPYSENYSATQSYDEKTYVAVAPAISTIHGFQWRRFYIGLGAEAIIGIPTDGSYWSREEKVTGGTYRYEDGDVTDYISIPVFACLRYDLFGSSKQNFFAELRAGSSIAFQKGFFGQLTIGGRKRLKKNSGINYGIIFRTRQMELWSSLTPGDEYPSAPYNVHSKFKAFGVGLMLGFDF